MAVPASARHPWRLPFQLLGSCSLAGLWFTSVYGPLDSTEWSLSIVLTGLLLFWGWIRSLQYGPAFELPPPLAPQPPQPLSVRLRWAFGHTTRVAAAFSAYVLVVALARGSTRYLAYGTSVWGILAAYWLAAIVCGILLAVLRPLTRFRLGAFVVGAIIGTAVYGTAMLVLPLPENASWWIPPILGTIFGGGHGLVSYDDGSLAV